MARIVKFRRWDKQRCISVPKEIYKALGWHLGDPLALDVRDDVLLIRRITLPVIPNLVRDETATEVAS